MQSILVIILLRLNQPHYSDRNLASSVILDLVRLEKMYS